MTKLSVSYPPPPMRPKRPVTKAVRLMWSLLWWAAALAAAYLGWTALAR